MTVNDFALVPMFVGVLAMLVAIVLSNRRTGDARRRIFAIGVLVALGGLFVGIIIIWVPKILAGEILLIVPAIASTAVVVTGWYSASSGLKPRPESGTDQFAESRRNWLFTTVVGGFMALLSLYAIGLFLGSWIDSLLGVPLQYPLAFIGAGIAAAAFVPVVVLKVRAARRRSSVRSGHPASDEVAEHAMKLAEKQEVKLLDYAMSSSLRRGLLFAGGFAAILLVIPIAGYIFAMVPGGAANPRDVPVPYVAVFVAAFLMAVVAIIDFFIRPVILEAQFEYQLAAISDEERLRIQSRSKHGSHHRFPAQLANPERSVRVLALNKDGTVRLENVAASILLRASSGDITAGAGEDGLEEFDDADFDDVPPEMVEAGVRVAERLAYADLALYGLDGFDAFEPSDGGSFYVVARTDNDYADFPEELGISLSGDTSA